ncbi:hypothetical protein EVAR_3519_1 [Eumeta japonica]|uniref:Uncharacterized protein n=1 Tax=Eumeta variegata TaxID=151549 RepID=A0A4C1SW33_EUMVA|nr:hypothetical protein EVAR_3519_1 [Eumeta japonica]
MCLSHSVANLAEAQKVAASAVAFRLLSENSGGPLHPRRLPSTRAPCVRYPIPLREAGNAMGTPLRSLTGSGFERGIGNGIESRDQKGSKWRTRPCTNKRNSAAVKLVTKAWRWRKKGTRERRRKGRGVLSLRITSFAGKSERQSFVRCTVHFSPCFPHRIEPFLHVSQAHLTDFYAPASYVCRVQPPSVWLFGFG